VSDQVIVPVLLSKDNFRIQIAKNGSCIYYKAHTVDIGFCITFYKIQGQTVNKLILNLNQPPTKKIQLGDIYVARSRLQHWKDLRILPMHQEQNLYSLCKLTRQRTLLWALSGYKNLDKVA